MSIVFRKEIMKSTILDPREGFAPVEHEMEFRFDPLTGRSSRLAHFGAIRPVPLNLEDYENKDGFCPFCPPYIEQVASRFPDEILPGGTMKKGAATLIANIAPYDTYSGLVVISDKHVLTLQDMNRQVLTDALSLGFDFLTRLRQVDPAIPYCFMGWNYMPPSGGGLIHAHIQVFGSNNPGNNFLDYLSAAQNYKKTYNRSLWTDYIEEERRLNERYLGTTGKVHWLVAFAPLGIVGDILAVCPGVKTPPLTGSDHIPDLVEGILRLFSYYRDHGVLSFNASLFLPPDPASDFPLLMRFSPRTYLNTRYYPPDANFFQVLLQQPLCVVRPEDTSRGARPYFSRDQATINDGW